MARREWSVHSTREQRTGCSQASLRAWAPIALRPNCCPRLATCQRAHRQARVREPNQHAKTWRLPMVARNVWRARRAATSLGTGRFFARSARCRRIQRDPHDARVLRVAPDGRRTSPIEARIGGDAHNDDALADERIGAVVAAQRCCRCSAEWLRRAHFPGGRNSGRERLRAPKPSSAF